MARSRYSPAAQRLPGRPPTQRRYRGLGESPQHRSQGVRAHPGQRGEAVSRPRDHGTPTHIPQSAPGHPGVRPSCRPHLGTLRPAIGPAGRLPGRLSHHTVGGMTGRFRGNVWRNCVKRFRGDAEALPASHVPGCPTSGRRHDRTSPRHLGNELAIELKALALA
jgi:hypothetical protein